MKRILLALVLINSLATASELSLTEEQFQFGNIRFDLPPDYINIDGYGAYTDYGKYFETITNSYYTGSELVITTEVFTNYAVGIWAYGPFESAYSSEISSGMFQTQDLELIDNIISSEAPANFWDAYGSSNDTADSLFDQVTTNSLMVLDGLIIKSFSYQDLGDEYYRWTGKFFIVIDNSSIYSFSSDYETYPNSVEDHPQLDVETIMSMDERVYSLDPISMYEGFTNVYNFGVSTNEIRTREALFATISSLELNITSLSNEIIGLTTATNNLNDQISTLQAEVSDLVAYTNDSTQLQIINDIVSTYQSQIDTLEDELDAIYVYTNRMTMSEAQAAMRDLRVGSQTFDVSNGTATIRMYVDESSDLTSSWTNTQHVLEVDIPADQDTMFYRFRMD